MTVEYYRQAGVEIGVVFEQRFYELVAEGISAENVGRWYESHESAVGLVGGLDVAFFHEVAHGEESALALAVAVGYDFEIGGEGVDSLQTYAVEAYRLLEGRRIVFAAGVHFRRHIDERAQRYAAAVVAHRCRECVNIDGNLPAEAHHIFVDGVVEYFLEQHIDAVVGIRAVAELADVHAGAPLYVFLPVEGLNVGFGVVGGNREDAVAGGLVYIVVCHRFICTLVLQRYGK